MEVFVFDALDAVILMKLVAFGMVRLPVVRLDDREEERLGLRRPVVRLLDGIDSFFVRMELVLVFVFCFVNSG